MSSHRALALLAAALMAPNSLVAQSISDPETSKKESEARKLAAEADEAEAEAAVARAEAEVKIMKAKLGGLAEEGADGTTEAGEGSGTIEATVLAWEEAEEAAAQILEAICKAASKICPPEDSGTVVNSRNGTSENGKAGGTGVNDGRTVQLAALDSSQETLQDSNPVPDQKPSACAALILSTDPPAAKPKLYIYTETEGLNFDLSETMQTALCGNEVRLAAAIAQSDKAKGTDVFHISGVTGILTLATAAAKLFKSDYEFQKLTVASDDLLFAKMIASNAKGRIGVPVRLPQVYRNSAMTSPLLSIVTQLIQKRDTAESRIAGHKAAAKEFEKKKDVEGAKLHNDAATALEAAVKAHDDYLVRITTPSDKGVTQLAEAARQAEIRKDLASGSYLLTLKMNAAGGNAYTKKNFWTFLGGAPYFVSGGALSSYALFEGTTGDLIAAGVFGSTSRFQRIGQVSRN